MSDQNQTDQNQTETETRAQLWEKLGDFNAGMLSVAPARFVPMSHNLDQGHQYLWFITAKGTDIADAAVQISAATFIIASEADKYHLAAEGTCVVVQDRAKLEELWNPVVDSWFDGGIDDPDVRLIRCEVSRAEAWETTGAVGFAMQMVKAQVTGDAPDLGRHIRYAL